MLNRKRKKKKEFLEMRTSVYIAFFIVMLIFTAINIPAITKTIKGDSTNAESTANSNNKPLSGSTNNYDAVKQASLLSSKIKTTTTTATSNNKHNTMSISTTIANENSETLLSMSMMTTKLMTAHKIEISTAKPSYFNKNSLRQREGQRAGQLKQQKQQQQQQQQEEEELQKFPPQQRHFKHQYTSDNKHPPCDNVKHTSSIVSSSCVGSNINTTNNSNTTNDTNFEDNNNNNNNDNILTNTTTTATTKQIDAATAKGYKPLKTLNTSNSVDTNNGTNNPLTLLSASTSSASSTFNVARNGFRDKINISNQRNEFTSEVDDVVDNNDDDDIFVETSRYDDVDFEVQVQVVQSALRPIQKHNTNIKNKNGLTELTNFNSSANNAKNPNNSVNNYVVPATSSFFEHVELVESSLSPDKRHELLLHRRKRYLVFPEGSSFQLVFDLIIGIVDYTSYALLGITCSVAWELPSKPPSEIIENFRDKLNDGTFGTQRRNDSTADKELQYVETQSKTPTRLTDTTTTTTSSPRQLINLGYENAWKPQKYVDITNYYQQKNSPKVATATPTATSYYGYKRRYEYGNYDESAAAPDMTGGAGFAQAQRKTLNDKAAQWHSQWNRLKPDKTYAKYDENYSTKKNYEWHSNDKWKYTPYDAFRDWHGQRMSSSSSDNNDNHDDNNADSVSFDERHEHQRNYANWRQKDNWWHSNNEHWRDKQQKWEQYATQFEAQKKNWKSNIPKKPITTYATPIYSDNNKNYARTSRQRMLLKEPPKHRIYPVFGRKRRSQRSLQNEAQSTAFDLKLECIHFREQLQSRQKLYGKIEQLFQTRGHNGTACVLRALCETGQRHQLPLHHRQHGHHYSQRHHDHQQQEPHSTTGQQSGPQSFITELLRAIFALPKDIRSREFESESKALHSHAGRLSAIGYGTNDVPFEILQREFEAHISWHYRDAHAYEGNCADRFATCEHSIWNDGTRLGGFVGPAFKM